MNKIEYYYKRSIEKTLLRYLKNFPCVAITGPRQAGKTTFLTKSCPDYKYITFDDPANIEFFNEDPKGFLAKYKGKVIFDEVQYVPKIFNYLKIEIDKQRNVYGRFIITGSTQFNMLTKITESLAGRIGLLTLLPFSFEELPDDYKKESIYKGCYPELVLKNYEESEFWFASYVDTYLSKDVRTLSNIGNLIDFQRFVRLLAANTSKILDMSTYAKEIGISVPTIKRWLSVLEASYIVFSLPPYYSNLTKRIIKSPKIYFYDTGLVSYLTGIKTFEQYENGPMAGTIFENYIISAILKKIKHNALNLQLFYLRTSDKTEVDLIIDHGRYREFIEIKKSATLKRNMFYAIKKFRQSEDKSIVLYNGDKFVENSAIEAVNYRDYLKNYLINNQ